MGDHNNFTYFKISYKNYDKTFNADRFLQLFGHKIEVCLINFIGNIQYSNIIKK